MKPISLKTRAIIIFTLIFLGNQTSYADDFTRLSDRYSRNAFTIFELPFSNYTGDDNAVGFFRTMILKKLDEMGFTVIQYEKIRPLLRENRIRTEKGITKLEGAFIYDETGADYVLMGSYDIFNDGEIPELAISYRLIKLSDMAIVKSSSLGITGSDNPAMFDDIPGNSIEKAGQEIFKILFKEFESLNSSNINETKNNNNQVVAIIPFDNLSKSRYAGRILTSVYVSVLIQQGFKVVEPGLISEIFRKNGRISLGEIDNEIIAAIAKEYDADYIITGQVDQFKPASSGNFNSNPTVTFGARTIDVESKRIIYADNFEESGSSPSNYFGLRAKRSIEQLVIKMVNRYIDNSFKQIDEDYSENK